jgi:hypothetical protein
MSLYAPKCCKTIKVLDRKRGCSLFFDPNDLSRAEHCPLRKALPSFFHSGWQGTGGTRLKQSPVTANLGRKKGELLVPTDMDNDGDGIHSEQKAEIEGRNSVNLCNRPGLSLVIWRALGW